jgi:hypothetical protein
VLSVTNAKHTSHLIDEVPITFDVLCIKGFSNWEFIFLGRGLKLCSLYWHLPTHFDHSRNHASHDDNLIQSDNRSVTYIFFKKKERKVNR